MEIKAVTERISSIGFLIVAILVMMESLRLKLDDIHNPGPGFMPFFLGLALAVLSLLSILSPDLRPKASAFWSDWKKGQNIFYIFAGLVIYTLLLKRLGFYLDTFWLMIFLFRFSGEKAIKGFSCFPWPRFASSILSFTGSFIFLFPKDG